MSAPAGWYVDPDGLPGKRYWDGADWTERYKEPPNKAVAFGVIVLGIVGVIMSMQSASLLTGTGTIWVGVGIAAISVAGAFILDTVDTVRAVCIICLLAGLGNALYMEKQMEDRRNEVSNIFG